jgi:hypothetical protein
MQAAVACPNLAFPLLSMQVEIGGRGDFGEELRRRELLGRPPHLDAVEPSWRFCSGVAILRVKAIRIGQ